MVEVPDGRLENLLGALVVTLGDATTAAAESVAGHAGAITAALTYIAQEPGLGIEELRGPLGRTQSATVRVVDRLVGDGLARRAAGRDGRSVAIHLTPDGEAAARRILDARRAILGEALGDFDGAERAALTGLVEKILATVTVDEAHSERICRMCDLAACPGEICPVEDAANRA